MCIMDERIGNIAKKTKVRAHEMPKQNVIPTLRIYDGVNVNEKKIKLR